MTPDEIKRINKHGGNCDNNRKTDDTPGCLSWIGVLVLALFCAPIGILTYAYCSSCVYYWYMPYVMASFPQFKLTAFIGLNAIVGMLSMPFFVQSILDIQKKADKNDDDKTPSSHAFDLILKVFVLPWVVLLIFYVMFKLITLFIVPVV